MKKFKNLQEVTEALADALEHGRAFPDEYIVESPERAYVSGRFVKLQEIFESPEDLLATVKETLAIRLESDLPFGSLAAAYDQMLQYNEAQWSDNIDWPEMPVAFELDGDWHVLGDY